MLKSRKHVFWEALFVTAVIFVFGLVIGMYFEQVRIDEANVAFYESEANLFDTIAFIDLFNSGKLSCEEAVNMNVDFADNIYEESKFIDKLKSSSKLTNSLKIIHKKYDLLRVVLWINILKVKGDCPKTNTLVYLYNYEESSVEKKAIQDTFSKYILELKERRGNNFILIPIAVDQNIKTLDYLLKNYEFETYPVILVNENGKIYDVESLKEIEKYLS